MEDYKTSILKLIDEAKRGTLDRNDLMKKLNLTGASEIADFDEALEELEEEMLIVRAKGNCYMNREQYGIEVGVIHINRKGVGYVDRPGKPSIMIVSARMKDAMEGDVVAVRAESYHARYMDSISGTVLKVLKRAKNTLVGTYISTPNGPKLWPDEEKYVTTLENLALVAEQHNITKTALIIVGDVVAPKGYDKSKLYDATFTTGFREGSSTNEQRKISKRGDSIHIPRADIPYFPQLLECCRNHLRSS